MKYNTVALIMAAGASSRFDESESSTPKQYLKIGGKTLLRIVVDKFLEHPMIDDVMVVVNPEHADLYKRTMWDLNLLPAAVGGMKRQDSVRNGLNALEKFSPEYVLIHDAARIFIEGNKISELIDGLDSYDAVTLGTQVVDTVKYAPSHVLEKTVSRDNLFLMQTPQGFKYDLIRELHNKYKCEEFTCDVSLVEHEGSTMVKIIEASMENFKITKRSDFEFAKRLLSVSV